MKLTRGQLSEQDRDTSISALTIARGLISLLLRAGEGITDLSARVHLHFSHLPWLNDTPVKPRVDHAPFPYRVVFKVFEVLRELVQVEGEIRSVSDAAETVGGRRWLGILNGIIGDKLHRWDNPLALSMSLLDEKGASVLQDRPDSGLDGNLVVFLHGLCMNETDWESSAHGRFIDRLRDAGHTPLWLRYNSGRAIPENGRALNETLEQLDTCLPVNSSIVLIGHSMGGLVIRGACEWARREQSAWIKRLTHCAYLGSPHDGAPLEKLGFKANSLLGFLPFTKPFMSLGRIRSRGIRDLRHGTIHPPSGEPSDTAQRFDESVEHFLVGASLGGVGRRTPIGDGLVSLDSALAKQDEFVEGLPKDKVKRLHRENLDHFQLMKDSRVYYRLWQWLKD